MVFEIHRTTAEHVISATDAALQVKDSIDKNVVADFIDTTVDSANNALRMAKQLGFLKSRSNGKFRCEFPYAEYLVTSTLDEKAAILRFVLEQYPPYKTFKARLSMGILPSDAANQTRALHRINAHRDIVLDTLTSFGTYANSLLSEGAGLYRPKEGESKDYLCIVEQVINDRETARMYIRRRMGPESVEWINERDVFEELVTGYQRGAKANEDAHAPVVHAGNAVDSFLSQLASSCSVNIQGANGINAKVDRLATNGNLKTKHKFMLKYLGHVRNAADHGTDSEISQAWGISENTAIEYVHVAQTVIARVVACYLHSTYIV